MKTRTVLTIAGSDSSGGAGIQADLKAIAAQGAYGASVITALTAQNTRGVQSAVEVAPGMIRAQLQAVFEDLDVAAVKTGMLGGRGTVELVAAEIERRRPEHFVCDPVMRSKNGSPLLADDAVGALADRLLPLAELVTPNVHEARALSGVAVRTVAEAREAGRKILARGSRAVLVKGGHLEEAPGTDILVSRDGERIFEGGALPARHTHGTGCTLSAAIAAHLAAGRPLDEAVTRAKEFVTEAIRAGLEVGSGIGPTNPFFFLADAERAARWARGLGRR